VARACSPRRCGKFGRLGIDSVVLALDNDASGRDGTVRAVERITRLTDAPTLRVLDPERLGDSKDPDAFVREHGAASFGALVADADCAVSWRAREFAKGITPDSETRRRRAALARAGNWLGTLPARYALEQEDAIRQVAERCGYSREAVQRAFRARFWDRLEGRGRAGLVIER
jgi:DNA primase